MTYPRHWLFQFGGTMPVLGEIWTNSIRFAPDQANAGVIVNEDDAAEHMLTTLATKFGADPSDQGLGYSNATRLEWGKFNEIGPDGKYADASASHTFDLPAPVVGSLVPGSYAPQLTACVSWRTARARGRASKGRIYIAMPNIAVSSNGRISPGWVAQRAVAWGFMLDAMNNFPGVDLNTLRASVVSGLGAPGPAEPITSVVVGDVMDTMRSRRGELVEAYSSAPVTAAP